MGVGRWKLYAGRMNDARISGDTAMRDTGVFSAGWTIEGRPCW